MCGTRPEAGGGTLTTCDPEQALARLIELHEKRGQESDQRPDLLRRMAHGNSAFMGNADNEIRELEREAQRNGSLLQWTCDQDTKDCEDTCRQRTSEEDEDS